MSKIIVVDPDRCTGCGLCEMACSVVKTGELDTLRSRIRVFKWDEEGVYLPILCRRCEEPVCATVCPVNAVYRDDSGVVCVDRDRCVNCFSCVSACPNGALHIDPVEQKVLRCDQCAGDPPCVRFCEEKALQWVEIDDWQADRRRSKARHLYGQ